MGGGVTALSPMDTSIYHQPSFPIHPHKNLLVLLDFWTDWHILLSWGLFTYFQWCLGQKTDTESRTTAVHCIWLSGLILVFAGLSHIIETRKVLDLRIDLKPSYLLIPKSGFYSKTSDLIIIDFGSFQVSSFSKKAVLLTRVMYFIHLDASRCFFFHLRWVLQWELFNKHGHLPFRQNNNCLVTLHRLVFRYLCKPRVHLHSF